MSELKDTITVRVNVEITPESLKTIVENAKKSAGPNQSGVYRVDTAGKVDEMISRFLLEKDFESYVKNTKPPATIVTTFHDIKMDEKG
jgi:tRNA(Glu) U13 pseudouridine synthase TruD